MADQKDQDQKQQQIKVKIPLELEQGVYANAVSVHFNNNECVIDMAYRLINPNETIIKVVSRVNMTHKTAESLLKVLSNSMLDWKNKSEAAQKESSES